MAHVGPRGRPAGLPTRRRAREEGNRAGEGGGKRRQNCQIPAANQTGGSPPKASGRTIAGGSPFSTETAHGAELCAPTPKAACQDETPAGTGQAKPPRFAAGTAGDLQGRRAPQLSLPRGRPGKFRHLLGHRCFGHQDAGSAPSICLKYKHALSLESRRGQPACSSQAGGSGTFSQLQADSAGTARRPRPRQGETEARQHPGGPGSRPRP